jgi:hypothetical protein
MSRTRFLVVVVLTAAVVFLGLMGCHWAVEQFVGFEPGEETPGRVQLVLDEQDVGLVRQGTPLAVRFAVVNTGSGALSLRQANEECCGGDESYETVTIEPRQTGEVVALLSADDLLTRGRKHVRFHTSDPESPDLWLTVRGTVIRQTVGP